MLRPCALRKAGNIAVMRIESAGVERPARLVVLVSGSGTNLQALLDACADPSYRARVIAVGADRPSISALDRAAAAGAPSFVLRLSDFPTREDWDLVLAKTVSAHDPDLVILAGFQKLVGSAFLERFRGRVVNTHPSLLPAFPGLHGPRDALEYGVTVTGCTIFLVDQGIDTGPILAQAAVPVLDDDNEATLHERIKSVERALLVATVGRMAREGYRVEGRKACVP